MSTFKEVMEALFTKEARYVISEGDGIEDAIVTHEAFFRHCRNEVRILCSDFKPEVLDSREVLDATRDMLERGVCMYLSMTGAVRNVEFLRLVLDERYEGQVFIWKGRPLEDNDGNQLSFMVVDGHAFRFEHNGKAVASANDTDFSRRLMNAFEFSLLDEKVEMDDSRKDV